MTEEIKEVIKKTILDLINQSASNRNILDMVRKHEGKVHFIPIKYRILGGILQGLNIKFGNFIEDLLSNFVEIDSNVDALDESGKKKRLFFTHQTDALIDSYITNRQLPNSPDDCTSQFDELLDQILSIEKKATAEDRQGIVKDIDGLFCTKTGQMVYTEIKYNDDHDTGKFADINRKFIKTWAGLAVLYNITDKDQLIPIIYYFNSTKRYGPIHTPSRNIMRGSQLFDKYLETKYCDVDNCLSEISEDPEIVALFDNLYVKIKGLDLQKRSQAKML